MQNILVFCHFGEILNCNEKFILLYSLNKTGRFHVVGHRLTVEWFVVHDVAWSSSLILVSYGHNNNAQPNRPCMFFHALLTTTELDTRPCCVWRSKQTHSLTGYMGFLVCHASLNDKLNEITFNTKNLKTKLIQIRILVWIPSY